MTQIIREWRQGDFLLRIKENSHGDGSSVTIRIEITHPLVRKYPVDLFIAYQFYDRGVVTLDLQGNGRLSGVRGKGLGTLLLNTAIQLLQQRLSGDCCVSGVVSDIEDHVETLDPKSRADSHTGRIQFWRSHGFHVYFDGNSLPGIEATVADLRERPGRLVLDQYPSHVPLENIIRK